MVRKSTTNRKTDYNRVYMKIYRKSEAGIRQNRINKVTDNLALKWIRATHPDVYKDIRKQATNQVDDIGVIDDL